MGHEDFLTGSTGFVGETDTQVCSKTIIRSDVSPEKVPSKDFTL